MPPEDIKHLLCDELQAEVIGIQTNTAFWEASSTFCAELTNGANYNGHTVEVKYWSDIKRSLREHSLYPRGLIDGMDNSLNFVSYSGEFVIII